MDKDTQFKFIEVVVKKYYFVEYKNEENLKSDITDVNGESIEHVIEDWFIDKRLGPFPLSINHATRDTHLIKEKLVEISVVDNLDLIDVKLQK